MSLASWSTDGQVLGGKADRSAERIALRAAVGRAAPDRCRRLADGEMGGA